MFAPCGPCSSEKKMTAEEEKRAWETHEREQLLRWRSQSYEERLRWLWQAKEFAARALKAKRAQGREKP